MTSLFQLSKLEQVIIHQAINRVNPACIIPD